MKDPFKDSRPRPLSLLRSLSAVCAIALLFGAFLTVQFVPDSDNEAQSVALLSSAERDDERSASRGGESRSATALDAEVPTTLLGSLQDQGVAVTTSPTVPPSTTTSAPPTTTTSTTVPPTVAQPPPTTIVAVTQTAMPRNTESGKASYYTHKPGGCAHKTLPKGTNVTVTNVVNGKTASCVVNDRGPFIAGRIVDLDITVFRQIASTSQGVVPVRIHW